MYPHIGHARDLLYYRPEKGGEERYIGEFVEQSMPDSGRPQLVVLRAVVVTKVDRNGDKIVLLLHFPIVAPFCLVIRSCILDGLLILPQFFREECRI